MFGKIDLEMEEGVRDMNKVDERLVSVSDYSSSNSSSFEDNIVIRK